MNSCMVMESHGVRKGSGDGSKFSFLIITKERREGTEKFRKKKYKKEKKDLVEKLSRRKERERNGINRRKDKWESNLTTMRPE